MEPNWTKSSFSNGAANCIEVTPDPDHSSCLLIRESDNTNHVVRTTVENWEVFIKGVKAGEFDIDQLS